MGGRFSQSSLAGLFSGADGPDFGLDWLLSGLSSDMVTVTGQQAQDLFAQIAGVNGHVNVARLVGAMEAGRPGGSGDGGEDKEDRRQSGNNQNGQEAKGESGKNIFNKAYNHYMEGTGTPLTIDASTLDFGNITQKDLQERKDGTYLLDLYKVNPESQAALALGKITLIARGNNQYTINSDVYDFNIEWQNGFSKRNVATVGAYIIHNPFLISFFTSKPFTFYFNGTIYIKP